ncbi:MAG: MATE family efflux transporter [Lachnospiraceae bacterium]|nr:MATE family efflux transporter [Lachnospiraceae bacterium]
MAQSALQHHILAGNRHLLKQKSTRERTAVQDMTSGDPMALIIGFALPMLGGMLFQQFYNIVDTMIVGKLLGVQALAGVGATGSVNFMIVGFCMGICSGFAIPISQRFGARQYDEMRRFLAHGIYMCGAVSVLLTVPVCLLCRQILVLMRTPEDILEYAYSYILIIFLGIPVIMAYNLFSGAIRALGDSKAPVVFLIVSSIVNIVLDITLILYAGMGVAGAALATVISQAVAALLAVFYILKKVPLLHIKREEWKAQGRYFKTLLVMGVPMGLQYSVTAIGSVYLQSAVNGLGSVYVAAQTAGGRIAGFFCTPYDALGSTMATYGGQNVGAGKTERLTPGLKAASKIGILYSLAAAFVLCTFGRSLLLMFVSGAETQVLEAGRMLLFVNSVFYIPLLFVNIVRFMIQGMGFSELAILAGVCEMVGRVLAALVLIPAIGYMGACLASPIAWILADIFLFTAYAKTLNKVRMALKKQNAKAEQAG